MMTNSSLNFIGQSFLKGEMALIRIIILLFNVILGITQTQSIVY